ncbi:MAG: hypothetical protein K9L59_03480 [Desulfobacterales bacterium]|nr:hypothetical protein [Desulfobacterales bacterium]
MQTIRKLVFLVLAALTALPAAGLCLESPAFSPYVESYGSGWIDWDEMAIYGIGRGMLDRHSGSRPMARRAGKIIALQSILKIAAGVHLDDRRSLADMGAGPLVIELNALIHFTEHREVFVEGASAPYYEVVLRSPMTGIQGLTGRLVEALKDRPLKWDKLPKRGGEGPEADDAPWLVLDARRPAAVEPLTPALFPKVLTDSGRIVYDLDRVDEEALKQRGMVRYVTMTGPSERLQLSRPDAAQWLSRLLFPSPAEAGEDPPRKKRGRFIVKDVEQVRGLSKTNLVISEQDARSLQAEDASSRILERCRVIVIVSSPVGGVEGRRPVRPSAPMAAVLIPLPAPSAGQVLDRIPDGPIRRSNRSGKTAPALLLSMNPLAAP